MLAKRPDWTDPPPKLKTQSCQQLVLRSSLEVPEWSPFKGFHALWNSLWEPFWCFMYNDRKFLLESNLHLSCCYPSPFILLLWKGRHSSSVTGQRPLLVAST